MAVELYDDHEQGERVKQWLKENGGGILLGIALAAGGVFGFRYWQANQQQHAFDAAGYYRVVNDQLAELAAAEQAQNTETDQADTPDEQDNAAMLEALATLQNDYADNLYAALATLQYADHNIRNGDAEAAAQQYQFIIDNSNDAEVNDLARLRLARVQLSLQQSEAALQTLAGLPEDSGHTGLAARIRGEAHLALGQREQALSAYEQAEEALGGSPDRMLEMRLADLRDVDIDAVLDNAPAAQTPPVFSETSSRTAEFIPTPTITAVDGSVEAQPADTPEGAVQIDTDTPGITDADGDE